MDMVHFEFKRLPVKINIKWSISVPVWRQIFILANIADPNEIPIYAAGF